MIFLIVGLIFYYQSIVCFIFTRKALEIICPKIDLHDNQIQKLAKH